MLDEFNGCTVREKPREQNDVRFHVSNFVDKECDARSVHNIAGRLQFIRERSFKLLNAFHNVFKHNFRLRRKLNRSLAQSFVIRQMKRR